MSIGSNIPPYPKRCGDIGCVFGSARYQHTIQSVIKDKYKNTTTYAVDGVTAAPVPLWYHEDECGNAQSPPYVDQLGSILSTVMNGYQFTGNTFTHDGSVDMTPPCRLAGFKSVQAEKRWYGNYGFNYSNSGKDCATDTTYTDTKYRKFKFTFVASVSRSDVWQRKDSGGTVVDSSSLTVTGGVNFTFDVTVNRLTGIYTVANYSCTCNLSSTDASGTTNFNGTTDPLTDGTNFFNFFFVTLSRFAVSGSPLEWVQNLSSDCSFKIVNNDGGAFGPPTVYSGTAAACQTYLNGLSPTDISAVQSFPLTVTFTPVVTKTNTQYKVDVSQNSSGFNSIPNSLGGVDEETVTSAISLVVTQDLSEAYTLAQVKTDTETLADEIDLNDHVAYPYRTDGNAFIAPYVIYNEVQATVSPLLGITDSTTTDPNAGQRNGLTGAVYSSDIIGTLLPSGYGQGSPRGVFRITHQNYYRDICGTPPSVAYGPRTIGARTPSYLPASCGLWTPDTKFTNEITPNLIWPCQFIAANTDGIFLQKWIETIIPPPNGSYNAARPYGADRFRIDESLVYCYDAGVLTDNAASPTIQPGLTLTGLWGGFCVDGFYNGATTDGSGNVTLGPKVFDVPTGWTVPSEDQLDVFAKLRWEDSTKHVPGFGGKLDVTATYDSGANETTFTYTSSPYIVDGDKISVMGFGDSVLGTNKTITRLGDTSCTVTGDYSTALWIVPYKLFDGTTDGTKYYFANDTHKSTFVARTWTLEMDGWTTLDSTVAQECLPITNCSPQTLLASPNTEIADYSMEWPATIDPNTVWIGEFMQWMQDPFYQTPHSPCGGLPPPDMTCKVPYVEARIAVGNNYGLAQNETAPTPPSPINLGATLAPPENADPTGSGAVVDLLNNPTKPFPIWAACGDDPA